MKNYIGTVLAFEEGKYNNTIRSFSFVLAAINEMGKAYEDLDSTFEFTQDVFEDLIHHGTVNVALLYANKIEAQIQQSNFTSKAIVESMRKNVEIDLGTLTQKLEKVHSIQASANSRDLSVEFQYIKIKDGKAVLDDEQKLAMKETFQTKIRTEEQNILYNLLLELKEKYKNLTSFLLQSGVDVIRMGDLISRFNGLCNENKGDLEINPYSITLNLKPNVCTIKQ